MLYNGGMKNRPFILQPIGKDYLWGGERLKKEYNKNIDLTPLAETWECSTHPDGTSIVASGDNKGMLLSELLKKHPEYLGSKHSELPILVKFIDAKKDLSVQVHPADEYAKEYENGQNGKTEMWYICDTDDHASIVYGFKENITPEKIKEHINEGTLSDDLNRITVQKGESYLIKAGTVHAIGAGCLIAEIQQNSNLTYRLYDYNRRNKDGKLRELHIDKALAVSNMQKMVINKEQRMTDELCSCQYFTVNRKQITEDYSLKTTKDSFKVLLVVEGNGTVNWKEEKFKIHKGTCMFIPAESLTVKIKGRITILDIDC